MSSAVRIAGNESLLHRIFHSICFFNDYISRELDKLKARFVDKNFNVVIIDVEKEGVNNLKFKSIREIDIKNKLQQLEMKFMATRSVLEPFPKSMRPGGDRAWHEYINIISNPNFETKQILQFLMTNNGSRAFMSWNEESNRRQMLELPAVNIKGTDRDFEFIGYFNVWILFLNFLFDFSIFHA